MKKLPEISPRLARFLWLDRQGLSQNDAFGLGKAGALAAIRRLGYVQIDTIYVVERAHHHILHSRVSDYRPEILAELQTKDHSVFEYITHALSYVPAENFRFYVRAMREHEKNPSRWYSHITRKQSRALLRRIETDGALSIREIEEERVEKDHEWASRKPSKRVLEHLFYSGHAVIGKREGMLKHYESTLRYFGWDRLPSPPSATEEANYRIDRTLSAQGVISLDSATYLTKSWKPLIEKEIRKRMKAGTLEEVSIPGVPGRFYLSPEDRARQEDDLAPVPGKVSILSPFDPIVIQRKRTKQLFGFDYLLECYVPANRRKYGYFSLPVLHEDQLVARIDAKADRVEKKLLLQSWHWEKRVGDRKNLRAKIKEGLEKLESFQFSSSVQ